MNRSAVAALFAPAIALFASGTAAAQAPVRSLTLEEALKLLDSQSLTLMQARARADEARALVRQARAPLLPSLSASGNYTRNNAAAAISIRQVFGELHLPIPSTAVLPNDTVIQPLEAWNAAGAVRVPLLVPNAWFDLAAAKEGERGTRAGVEATRAQLRAGFAQAAWSASATEELVEASERAVDTAREHVQTAQRAVKAGTGVPLTALQAQTEQVRRESDLARARAERDRAHLTLGVLLGRAEPLKVVLSEPAPPSALDLAALTAQAMERRPELRAQQAQVAAAERQIDSASWRLAPQLSASFGANASTVPFPTGDKTGWRATADLSWTLYDGGYRYGRRDQAQAQAAAAKAGLEVQRIDICQQVQDAVRDIEVAKERLRLAVQQRDFAALAASTAKRSFGAGLATSLDVLDANDRLYQADVALAEARARLGTALVSLEHAVGAAAGG